MNKTLTFYALSALCLTACSSRTNDPKPVDPVAITKHRLLSSVITESVNGTSQIDYEYDGQNRMVAMHSKSITDPFVDVADHMYSYDNEGNLTRSEIRRGKEVSIFDYTYKDGQPTFVSYSQPGNPSQGHTLDIYVQGKQVVAHSIKTPSGEHASVDFSYQNGNKTTEVHKSHSETDALTFTLTFDDVYGTHNSPYLYSGYKWVLPDVPFANKNEVLKETGNNNGSVTTETYQYDYDKQNYPIKAVITSTYKSNNNAVLTYKYIDAK